MNNTPSKRILVRFEKATKNGGYNDYYTLATDEDISVGFEAKIVDELPEVGDTKYIYLVPSDESNPDDTYDEYMWVEKDGTYGWEPIGSTAITIEMDDAMSSTSENPVQNKVIKGYVDGSLVDKLSDDTTFWGQTAANGVVSGTIDFGDGATIETYQAEGTNVDLLLSQTDGTYTSAIDVGSRSIHIGTSDTSTVSFDTTSGGVISAGGAKIIGVGNPTSSGDAATKGYVDTGLSNKQGILTAGDNISIVNDVISGQAGIPEILTTDSDFDSNLNTFAYTHDTGIYKITNGDSRFYWFTPKGTYGNSNYQLGIMKNHSIYIMVEKYSNYDTKVVLFGAYGQQGNLVSVAAYHLGIQNPICVMPQLDGPRNDYGYLYALSAQAGGVISNNVSALSNRVSANETQINTLNKAIINGGTTAPTTSTEGAVGTLYSYVDTTGNTPEPHLMVCTAVSGSTYTWTDLLA